MRGICIRLLESYPDHPGLLLLRGLSESLSSGCDETLIGQSLYTAHHNALERYNVQHIELKKNLIRLAELTKDQRIQITGPLMYASTRLVDDLNLDNDLITNINLTWEIKMLLHLVFIGIFS